MEGHFAIGDKSFEETDTKESASSLSEVSYLDENFGKIHLESESSDEEVTSISEDDGIDPMAGLGHAQTVVMHLFDRLLGSY